MCTIKRKTLICLILLAVAAAAPADVTLGVTPSVGLYTGVVGFEGIVNVDWEPGFLEVSLPNLALAGGVGYSYLSQERTTTNGISAALGAAYTVRPGMLELYLKPGVLGGVQFSSFSIDGADPEFPLLLLPYAEIGYAWPFGLTTGIYAALKVLFYEENERSLTLGARVGYSFGG